MTTICKLICLLLSIFFLGYAEKDSYAVELFDPGLAEISIKIKNDIIPYREFALYALPGETIPIQVYQNPAASLYSLSDDRGISAATARNKWDWEAPAKTGIYTAKIANETGTTSISLNVFVMVPYSNLKGESLNGFRIGKYPDIAYRQLKIYEKPAGFIEVTPENKGTMISPHFRIEQFLSKQRSNYPKYLVLKERLLLKLEMVLQKANEKNYSCSSFVIMSGYRTPFYNQLIGNVMYSRHVWGGAADIFIDETPRDGVMDDLNRDGVINYLDAGVLYDIIDELYGMPFYELFVGGLGRYKRTNYHGPFVHVDVRGFRARWGL